MPPRPEGTIAFSRAHPDGTRSICVMDLPSRDEARVTRGAVDETPRWSPDGASLAFVRQERSSAGRRVDDLYVVALPSLATTRLTSGPRIDGSPEWSPSGDRLVFHGDAPGGEAIYVVGAAGGDVTRITAGDMRDLAPHWSPDGSMVAFARARGERRGTYLASLSGAADELFISTGCWQLHSFPWSPVRAELAVPSAQDDALVVHDVRTRAKRVVVRAPGAILADYSWSPDGMRLAYGRYDATASEYTGGRSAHIYAVSAGGGEPVQLTFGHSRNVFPTWSPDGRWIAFSSNRTGRPEVYIVPSEGGTSEQLTSDGGDEPVWCPVVTRPAGAR